LLAAIDDKLAADDGVLLLVRILVGRLKYQPSVAGERNLVGYKAAGSEQDLRVNHLLRARAQ
jgi:hypothetical protein